MNIIADRPLSGKGVLVTRAKPQNAELCERIEQLGGVAYEFPTIRIVEPPSYAALDAALNRLKDFHWIVFTSVNAVDYFFRRLNTHLGNDYRQLDHARIAANGPKTANALREKGLTVTVSPNEYRAEVLLSELERQVKTGEKILLPRANIARNVLPEGLRAIGCDVVDVDAYHTEVASEGAADVAQMLMAGAVDIVTFTSSSTVRNFVHILDGTGLPWREGMRRVSVACIGPLTADTAKDLGLEVASVATDYTIDGLIEAMLQIV